MQNGFTPLHSACSAGNEALVRSLLAQDDIDVNAMDTVYYKYYKCIYIYIIQYNLLVQYTNLFNIGNIDAKFKRKVV
jgi:ankyrin repeat protein